MPLIAANLAQSFALNLSSNPPRASLAAAQLAASYLQYASQGLVGGGALVLSPMSALQIEASITGKGIPPSPIVNPAGLLAASLFTVFLAPQAATPSLVASAWASGIAAFWPGIPITGLAIGSITACAGASSLVGTLTPIFTNVFNTSVSAASLIASALDAATRTTLGLVEIAPSPGPVPMPLV